MINYFRVNSTSNTNSYSPSEFGFSVRIIVGRRLHVVVRGTCFTGTDCVFVQLRSRRERDTCVRFSRCRGTVSAITSLSKNGGPSCFQPDDDKRKDAREVERNTDGNEWPQNVSDEQNRPRSTKERLLGDRQTN